MAHNPRRQIIVIDDDPDLASLFCDGLKSAGYKTVAFDDPKAAIEYISKHNSEVSLVITDWKMPKMNGLELTKIISYIDDRIKVMLMSAYELEKNQLKEINKCDYMKKPFHISKLIETVKKELTQIPCQK